MPDKKMMPIDIPSNPRSIYLNQGWKGYGDWLGTGRIANFNKVYRPFEEARAFVQSLEIKGFEEWSKFCKGQLP
jgi:hypothetical protein